MFSSLVVLIGLLCFLFAFGSNEGQPTALSGGSGTSNTLYPTHPHAIYHRQAQEIMMTFITQLNTNKANPSQLKSLLMSIPDETVKVFQLAGMTLSIGSSGDESESSTETEDQTATTTTNDSNKKKEKSPSEVLRNYPLLHMLLNQYMLSANATDKQLFLELFSLAMTQHGADPSIPLNNDPPLYIKGVMIKEMELVKSIIESSQKSITNEIIARSTKISRLLKLIYALPAEVVPIAKLLLHVEKLTHKYYDSLPEDAKLNNDAANGGGFNATDIAVRLLLNAKLDRPSLSAAQLMRHSSTYNHTIQHLTSYLLPENQPWNIPGQLETTKIISMFDIAQSMNELLVIIPQALVDSIFLLPNDRKEVAIEHFLDLHVIPDEQDRNCFHYLAAANSVKMIEVLMNLFDRMIDAQHSSNDNEMAMISEKKIRQLAETLLNSLSQVDHRGHTPLSYAEVRYGNHAPVTLTLKNFISYLIRIFEGDFTSFSRHLLEDNNKEDVQEMEEILIEHDGAIGTEEEIEVGVEGLQELVTNSEESEPNEADTEAGDESKNTKDNIVEPPRRELPESEHGGWNPERLTIFDEVSEEATELTEVNTNSTRKQYYAPCDILEIWDEDVPNVDEFFVRYINTATPVVFRGAALKKSSQMNKLREKFSKKKFVRNYGNVQVTASTLPYSDSFGVQSSVKLMKDVANSDQVVTSGNNSSERVSVPLYTFTTASPQWAQKLNKDVPFPEAILSKESADKTKASTEKKAAYSHELQFYLGPAGTGAPVHFHGHAINTLAYGEKVGDYVE